MTLPGDPDLYIAEEVSLVDNRSAAVIELDGNSFTTDTFDDFKDAVTDAVKIKDAKGNDITASCTFTVSFDPADAFPGSYTVTVDVSEAGLTWLKNTAEFTVTAQVQTYAVKWDIDGDGTVDKTTKVAYNSVPTPPAPAEKDGKSFAGWSPALVAVDGTAVTYTATYSDDTFYTVNFIVDGEIYATQNVNATKNQVVVAPADPDKDYAIFTGWTNSTVVGTTPTADVELVAQWITDTNDNNVKDIDETITVVLGSGGSLTIDGQTVTSGDVIIDSTAATHALVATPADLDGNDGSAGYVSELTVNATSVGSYADYVLSGNAALADGDTVTVNFATVKVTAKDNAVSINGWKGEHNVDYSGILAGYQANLTTNNFLDTENTAVADGTYTVQMKTAGGWETVSELTTWNFAYLDLGDRDIRILWTPADAAKYPAVTSNTAKADIGEARTAPQISLNETAYSVDQLSDLIEQIKQNTTVTSAGTDVTADCTLSVTVDPFPGSGKANITVTNDGPTWVASKTASVFDITAEINKYTVIWDAANGTTPVSEQIPYGTVPTAPADPSKAPTAQYTYAFTGWSPEISAVTGAVTYAAQYSATVNSYTVTWKNYDGTVLGTDTINYGEIPSYDENEHGTPVKVDASWNGWDKTLSEVVGDVTYTAVFTDDTVYTVTFKNGDAVVYIDYINITDGEVTATHAITDESYKIFDAWYHNGAPFTFGTSITGNIVLEAKWITDVNNNNVLDATERVTITSAVTGDGTITVSGGIQTAEGYVYDSTTGNTLTVNVNVNDTDGFDGVAGYISAVADCMVKTAPGVYTLTVANGEAYHLTATISQHTLTLVQKPTAYVNLHSSKLEAMAKAEAVKSMVLTAVLGTTEYNPSYYIVEKDVNGTFIDVEVTIQSDPTNYAKLLAALANDVNDGDFSDTFRITQKSDGIKPAVTKTAFVTVIESRQPAAAAHNGKTYVSSVLDGELLKKIEADISVSSGNSFTIAWADNIPASLIEGKQYQIDVVVTVLENANYLGNEQTITVTVNAPIITGSITIESEAEMNFNVSMTDANKVEMVLQAVKPQFVPQQLKDVDTTVWYRASTARLVPLTINFAAMDLGMYGNFLPETATVQIEVDELWWNIGVDFPKVDAPTNGRIEEILINDLIPNYGMDYALGRLTNEQMMQILADTLTKYPDVASYYEYLGTHAFGENDVVDADGNILEVVKLTQEDTGFGPLTSGQCELTLKDLRTATSIVLNSDVAVTYGGYTPEELMKALVEGVYDAEGNRIGGAELVNFVTDVSKLPASEGIEIQVKYPGDTAYKSSTASATIVVNKATVDVQVDNRLIKWEKDLSYTLPVSTIPAGIDTINFIVGLDVSDVNVDGGKIKGIMGEVQLLLPEELQQLLISLDNTLSDLLGINISFADGSSMKLSELQESLSALGGLVKDTQYQEYVDVLLNMLGSLPTETADVMVTVGGELPTDVGVYLIGGVSADSNYETDFGVGFVVITPDGIKAELDWKQTDDNSIITRSLLTSGAFDLSAEAVSVAEGGSLEEATDQIVELFIGLDVDGNIVLETDQTKLNVGAYAEVAMIVNWGNQMYYSEPIARAFVVIAETLDVQFTDENGQINNDRHFVFDNQPQDAMENVEVTYKYDDLRGLYKAGDKVTDYAVKYLYTGVQTNGKPYAGFTAPVHAGAYTVAALVTVRNASGEITHAGVAVGALVIEPTTSDVTVKNETIRWDGNSHKVSDMVSASSKVEGITPDTTIISAGLSADLDNINGLSSINGNVNIDLPAWLDNVMKKLNLLEAGYGLRSLSLY